MGACASKSGSDKDEFAGLGRVGGSSEPPPGVYRPIAHGDVAAIQERGVLLFNLLRSLELGFNHGAQAVGAGEGDVILPLTDVDPGGRSAQVMFVRWTRDKVGADGGLHPKYARRWLLVSLILEPERVLDRELLDGDLGEDTVEFHRAAAMLAAAKALREKAPDSSFHLFTMPEQMATGNRRISTVIATRVYALGVRETDPDFEVLVDVAKKSRIPEVLQVTEVHAPGAVSSDSIRVTEAQPAPASVARAMRSGVSGSVEVVSSSGLWLVDTRSGRVSRP